MRALIRFAVWIAIGAAAVGGALYALWRFAFASMTVIVVALALGACSPAVRAHASRMTLGLAVAGTACDWGQTRSAAERGWRDRVEANPMLGSRPSVGDVNAYMAAAIVGTIVVGELLPESARPYFYGAVGALEVHTVIGNLDTTRGLCGVSGAPVAR